MQDLSFRFSIYHASWHGVSTPISTLYGVWFSYDCNMPLGMKFLLLLHCIYMEFSSHHIVASPLARSWAPIMLHYAIPCTIVKVIVCCVWSYLSVKLLCCRQYVVLFVYQVVLSLMYHLVVCQVIVWLSSCFHCVVIMVSSWVVSVMFRASESMIEGPSTILTSEKGIARDLYHNKNNDKIGQKWWGTG